MWKSSLAVRVLIEVAQTALAYVSLLMFFFFKDFINVQTRST